MGPAAHPAFLRGAKTTKAKMLKIASKRFRGAFILAQLQRVVVLVYDYEHDAFARLWKALPDQERQGFALPLARAFVSETKLPGLVEETTAAIHRHQVQTQPYSAGSTMTSLVSAAPSFKPSDMSTTESQVWSHRSPSPSPSRAIGKSEPPSSPPRRSPPPSERERADDDDAHSVASQRSSATSHQYRYLPYTTAQRSHGTKSPRDLHTARAMFHAPLAPSPSTKAPRLETNHEEEKDGKEEESTNGDDDSYESESEDDSDEEWFPRTSAITTYTRPGRGAVRVKGEPDAW